MSKRKNKMKPKNQRFIDSAILNNVTFQDYFSRLKLLATSIFEWVNLPDTMNARYIEEVLFQDGVCALLYDPDTIDKETNQIKPGYGYINTRASSNGYVNIYGLPTKLNCYSYSFSKMRTIYNGLAKPNKNEACIYVLNNYDRLPTWSTLELFAYRFYEIQRSIDTNIINQKIPMIIVATEEQRLSVENMYSQIEGNKPAIVVDKNGLGVEQFKCLQTGIPFVADKLTDQKKEVWNEVLTFLGINNIPIEKRERAIADEVNANNEMINLFLQAFYKPRKQACEWFNQLYGTHIDVRLNSDLHNIIKQVESTINDIKPTDPNKTIQNLGLEIEV